MNPPLSLSSQSTCSWLFRRYKTFDKNYLSSITVNQALQFETLTMNWAVTRDGKIMFTWRNYSWEEYGVYCLHMIFWKKNQNMYDGKDRMLRFIWELLYLAVLRALKTSVRNIFKSKSQKFINSDCYNN